MNDGLDNDCPGEDGFGVADELDDPIGFFNPADPTELSWTAQSGAVSYEVARADSADFSTGCTLFPSTMNTFEFDAAEPGLGAMFYYLVRPDAPNLGSWGTDSLGIERLFSCP